MSEVDPLESRLESHLQTLEADANIPLDEQLFEESEVFLVPRVLVDRSRLGVLVTRLSRLVRTSEQDPRPAVRVLAKLIEPYSFSDVLALDPPVDFVAGLDINADSFHPLILGLISKAAASPKDAAILAGMPAVVYAFVKLWLSTPDMGCADRAAKILVELLTVDKEGSQVAVHGVGDDLTRGSRGQGLMWRRVFGDQDVYGLIYNICSLQNPNELGLGKKEKTVAQARLMAVLPRIGVLDWEYLVRSHHADIEKRYGIDPETQGLLDFVCSRMVETKNDVLVHMSFLQFLTELITEVIQPSTTKNRSVSLDFLIRRGHHDRAVLFWIAPDDPRHDPLDINFLYGPSAAYFAAYATQYPHAFLESSDVRRAQLRLGNAVDRSANSWAHGESPKHDLNVLVSIPRVALLPQKHLGSGRKSSPLLQLPSKITNADALNAMANVFNGSSHPPARDSSGSSITTAPNACQGSHLMQNVANEAAAAQALYIAYINYHETFFSDIITHADTVAVVDKALAAINLLSEIIAADWTPLPRENRFDENAPPANTSDLPSYEKLASMLPQQAQYTQAFPEKGIHVLFLAPGRDKLLPYLLQPPQMFSNLVGGRGDPESAVYRIAMAKWDLLQLVHRKMKEVVNENVGNLLTVLETRIRDGPWGATSGVGGQIGTVEL